MHVLSDTLAVETHEDGKRKKTENFFTQGGRRIPFFVYFVKLKALSVSFAKPVWPYQKRTIRNTSRQCTKIMTIDYYDITIFFLKLSYAHGKCRNCSVNKYFTFFVSKHYGWLYELVDLNRLETFEVDLGLKKVGHPLFKLY